MFVVIQEVGVKTVPLGEPKRIETEESYWRIDGQEICIYGYRNSMERFERPVRKSYRISVHQSYRENGKVRKRQTVICTIGYYDVTDWGGWIGDFVKSGLRSKAEALGLSESELSDMIYEKWQPIVDGILAEFQQTEEYKAREENKRVIREHGQRIDAFVREYGVDREEYKRCYDVFGELRNPEYLKKIKADHKAREEYERRSREQSRSYYEESYSNYRGYSGGSYSGGSSSNYDEPDKAMLKKFYRTLSKAFHPDSNPGKDTSEEMKMLNRLKSEWGL